MITKEKKVTWTRLSLTYNKKLQVISREFTVTPAEFVRIAVEDRIEDVFKEHPKLKKKL